MTSPTRPFTFKDLARFTGRHVCTVRRNEVPWGLRPYRVQVNARVIGFRCGGVREVLRQMGFEWLD